MTWDRAGVLSSSRQPVGLRGAPAPGDDHGCAAAGQQDRPAREIGRMPVAPVDARSSSFDVFWMPCGSVVDVGVAWWCSRSASTSSARGRRRRLGRPRGGGAGRRGRRRGRDRAPPAALRLGQHDVGAGHRADRPADDDVHGVHGQRVAGADLLVDAHLRDAEDVDLAREGDVDLLSEHGQVGDARPAGEARRAAVQSALITGA